MEEEKAAAYYDELTRKGEGAARFKQGLGFSSASNDSAPPPRGSALSSSSSFLSSFVKASSPSKATELPKEAQLSSIQNKLKKKPSESKSQSQSSPRVSIDRDDSHSKRRIRSRSRDRYSRHRSRSRSRDSGRRSRHRSRSRDRDRRSRRSRSRSRSRSRDDYRRRRGDRSRSRSRERDRARGSRRRRSRSESPRMQKSEKKETRNGSNVKVDYGKLIEGYGRMTPAERVKAKMKLQLSETVVKDEANMGSGWERFEFDKDAPLDDEEIEAAEDDVVLVKNIGQSFRFSAVEARKEDALRTAHDEAMFGAPSLPPAENDEEENTEKETSENAPATSLLSEQVMTMQQGSWRDRIRKA